MLEHMVDTVLYFEGDRYASHRILRSVKNRFGSTNEIGVFEMTDKGLQGSEQSFRVYVKLESQRGFRVSGGMHHGRHQAYAFGSTGVGMPDQFRTAQENCGRNRL